MKRYTETTHDEWIKLEHEDVKTLIELEIAHEGIKPEYNPEKPTLEQEGVTRSVCVFNVNGMLLENEEDAHKVAQMSTFTQDYDYDIGYNYKCVKPIVGSQVVKEFYFDNEDLVRVKPVLQLNKSKKGEYEKQLSTYNEYIKATGSIRDKVWREYHNALNFQHEINLAKTQYEKYKKLANEDEEIAKGFFRDAYKNTPELLSRIIGDPITETCES